jgi:hypothetical protein
VTSAELFLERARARMVGQAVTGRTVGRRLLSVSVGTAVNVRCGFGVGFHPKWELSKEGTVLLRSDDLNLTNAPTHEAWMVARGPTDLLDDRVLQELMVDFKSGMIRMAFESGLEVRTVVAESGQDVWYVRDLETGWLLKGTTDGLRLGPDV